MLLEITGLTSHYGRIQAIHGIDVTVAEGELVALVGANGAGKTTLLRSVSGVQPVTAGTIRFDGQDITRMPADKRVELGILQVPARAAWFPATGRRSRREPAPRRPPWPAAPVSPPRPRAGWPPGGAAAGQLRFAAGILQADVTGDGAADFEVEVMGVATLQTSDLVL